MGGQRVGPPSLSSNRIQHLPHLSHQLCHDGSRFPPFPRLEEHWHAAEIQLVTIEIVASCVLADKIDAVLPNLGAGVVKGGPQLVLHHGLGELSTAQRVDQVLGMLLFKSIARLVQGVLEGIMKVIHTQGAPDLQAAGVAAFDHQSQTPALKYLRKGQTLSCPAQGGSEPLPTHQTTVSTVVSKAGPSRACTKESSSPTW